MINKVCIISCEITSFYRIVTQKFKFSNDAKINWLKSMTCRSVCSMNIQSVFSINCQFDCQSVLHDYPKAPEQKMCSWLSKAPEQKMCSSWLSKAPDQKMCQTWNRKIKPIDYLLACSHLSADNLCKQFEPRSGLTSLWVQTVWIGLQR